MRLKIVLKLVFSVSVLFAVGCSERRIIDGGEQYLKPIPQKVVTSNGDDPFYGEQWYLQKINAENAWTVTKGSPVLKVAIISTGVDYNHPDLSKNILFNKSELANIGSVTAKLGNNVDEDKNGFNDDFVGYDFVAGDGLAFDQVGWGTAAAGVIGAVHDNGIGIKGINSNVSLIPIRYIDDLGGANILNMIDSLKYALAMNSDVIFLHLVEMKLDGPSLTLLQKVLSDFETRKIPIVISGGNLATIVAPSGPKVVDAFSNYSNVLVVTATDTADRKTPVANYGDGVSLASPGMNIKTTDLGGGYKEYFGTTMAAAQVAGAITLAISIKGAELGTSEILKIFRDYDNSNPVAGQSYGSGAGNFGVLDMKKVFAAMMSK